MCGVATHSYLDPRSGADGDARLGIKVATLPVIALDVGIGVDYALYVLSITLRHLRDDATLSEGCHYTLLFTGKVVLLTGFMLAAGVATWAFASINFQADMGLFLAFMFLWNMRGALILLPSLAYFLLADSVFVLQSAPKLNNTPGTINCPNNIL
jgi:uncharacterized protein